MLDSVASHTTAEQRWLANPITQCIKRAESHDAAHPNGNYRAGGMEPFGGAWQFDVVTWHGLGYSGLPNEASPAVQDAAAFQLYLERGYQPWQTASGCGA